MRSEFTPRAQETIDSTTWDEKTKKAVSATEQELEDTADSHKSMTWLEFDESAGFGKNEEAKAETILSESDSEESNGLIDYGVASAVSTFATKVTSKKTKTKNFNNVDTSDDVSAFTQITQGTMETRIVPKKNSYGRFHRRYKNVIGTK